jgi:hypothetical protein
LNFAFQNRRDLTDIQSRSLKVEADFILFICMKIKNGYLNVQFFLRTGNIADHSKFRLSVIMFLNIWIWVRTTKPDSDPRGKFKTNPFLGALNFNNSFMYANGLFHISRLFILYFAPSGDLNYFPNIELCWPVTPPSCERSSPSWTVQMFRFVIKALPSQACLLTIFCKKIQPI